MNEVMIIMELPWVWSFLKGKNFELIIHTCYLSVYPTALEICIYTIRTTLQHL